MHPAEFFVRSEAVFAGVDASREPHERHFRIADQVVTIRFAGSELVRPLTRAIDHLRIPPGSDTDLTILAWTGARKASAPPPPDWSTSLVGAHGVIDTLTDDRFLATWMHEAGGLQMLDRTASKALYWVREAGDLPYWETGAPMRAILDAWTATRGIRLVHAAAVGDRRGAILLAGRGGSGKSSTALQVLNAPLDYLSDDYVLIDPRTRRVFSLYQTGKVDAPGLERLSFLKSSVTNPDRLDREKALLFPNEAFPHKVLNRPLTIRAIALPRITSSRCVEWVPASHSEGLRALAPSTLLQSCSRSGDAVAELARLASSVPAVHLKLGSDAADAAKTLGQWLDPFPFGDSPLVSVVIAAHDPGRYLSEALESVAAQDLARVKGRVEVIVVDDGSEEDLAPAMEAYRSRLNVQLVRQRQAGPSAARNRGLELARGEFIAFLDADDIWPAGTLSFLSDCLQADEQADVIQGWLRNYRTDSSITPHRADLGPPRYSFNLGSMMFRKRVFANAGLLNEALRFSEDVEFLVRLRERGIRRTLVAQTCLFYRRHRQSLCAPMQEQGTLSQEHLKSWAHILKGSLNRRRAAINQPIETAEHVSVIIVVKNGEQFIRDAIRSALGQTCPPAEVIVVDGQSRDRTCERVREFPHVRLIQQPGTGLADARNAGIRNATATWIAFLDHDDLWPPDRLERQLQRLRDKPDAEYSLGRLEYFIQPGTERPTNYSERRFAGPQAAPTPGTLLARRRLFDNDGMFDTRYSIGCDLEWIKRMRDRGVPTVTCDDVLLMKRIHASNTSHQVRANRSEIFDILRRSLKN